MFTHVLTNMPEWLDRRHSELNRAARECYRLRNDAEGIGDLTLADDMQATGDVYFLRALALTAEWYE